MSEFTNTIIQRGEKLGKFMIELINRGNGAQLTKNYKILETKFIPKDILVAFDYVFEHEDNIEKIKIISNKTFNLLYKTLNAYPTPKIPKGTVLDYLKQDNEKIDKFMKQTKELVKQVNKSPDAGIIEKLYQRFETLQNVKKHYSAAKHYIPSYWKKHGKYPPKRPPNSYGQYSRTKNLAKKSKTNPRNLRRQSI